MPPHLQLHSQQAHPAQPRLTPRAHAAAAAARAAAVLVPPMLLAAPLVIIGTVVPVPGARGGGCMWGGAGAGLAVRKGNAQGWQTVGWARWQQRMRDW